MSYKLGRIALLATRSKRVFSLGGGWFIGIQAEASFADGVAWTVFAHSRGKPEVGPTLADWAASCRSPHLDFVREQNEEEAQRPAEAQMEAARMAAEEEGRQRIAEENARRLAEDDARRVAEAQEDARRAEEEELQRVIEENARRVAEDDRRRRAEEE